MGWPWLVLVNFMHNEQGVKTQYNGYNDTFDVQYVAVVYRWGWYYELGLKGDRPKQVSVTSD